MSNSLSASAFTPLTARDYKTLWLATLGGVLEYYDFIVFIFFANTIGNLFFPPEIPDWVRQFQTFGIFAAGYLARPLGGRVDGACGGFEGSQKDFHSQCVPHGVAHFGHRVVADLRLLGCLGSRLLVTPAHPARSSRW